MKDMTNNNWELIEQKMVELRIWTNTNWRNGEYELAVLGEKVLRTAAMSMAESEKIRSVEQRREEAVLSY
jgi:hypothetical protein